MRPEDKIKSLFLFKAHVLQPGRASVFQRVAQRDPMLKKIQTAEVLSFFWPGDLEDGKLHSLTVGRKE